MTATPNGSAPGPGLFEVDWLDATPSPGLADWLADERVGLIWTTGDRLMLAGLDADGAVQVREHVLEGAYGLATVGSQTLHVAGRWQLQRLENALIPPHHTADGHDRLFLTQTAHTTGAVGALDVAIGTDGRVLFTSTLCNCVATVSPRHNFTAVWRPPFVSALIAEERCRLTGMATLPDSGALAYVTCGAETDTAGAWRDHVTDGGVVVDVQAGRVLSRGLSSPHTPRLHGERLYVTAAGTGELVEIDRDTGAIDVVARLPGLARGLAFHGDYAIVGCSRVADDGPYAATPVAAVSGSRRRHGIVVVDLARRQVVHSLFLAGGSGDTFGVAALAEVASPGAASVVGLLREPLSVAEPIPLTGDTPPS